MVMDHQYLQVKWFRFRLFNDFKLKCTYEAFIMKGASSYIGASANSVNIAAHQSLISGASISNLVGIQNGYGSHNNLDNSGL